MSFRRDSMDIPRSALVSALLALFVQVACRDTKPSAGAEGGPCYGNGTCNADLTCLSKLCVASPTQSTNPAKPDPPSTPSPVAAKPPTTAVILDDLESAAVLACSIGDKLVGSAWKCSQEMTGDLTATSLAGGQRRLGKPKTLKCDPTETGDVQSKRAGFHLDEATSPQSDNLMAPFLIWPASRARDAIAWTMRPRVDLTALTKSAAEHSRGLKYKTSEGEAPYQFDGGIEVRGSLTADIDGDDKNDTIYSVALSSDNAPFWQPRFLLAELGSKPGTILKVGDSFYAEIQAVAAIDLNGDGRDEVLVTEPYHEGSGSFVGRFNGSSLDRLGSWGCGL